MLNYVSKTHKILETSIFGIKFFSGLVPNNFVPIKIFCELHWNQRIRTEKRIGLHVNCRLLLSDCNQL